MTKLELALRSRTFWTLVLVVLLNCLPQIRAVLPDAWRDLVTVALGALATYLHVNPSMVYATPAQIVAQKNPLVSNPLAPPRSPTR
jgi:hypothetical protein